MGFQPAQRLDCADKAWGLTYLARSIHNSRSRAARLPGGMEDSVTIEAKHLGEVGALQPPSPATTVQPAWAGQRQPRLGA